MIIERRVIVPLFAVLAATSDGMTCFCVWAITTGDHSFSMFFGLYFAIAFTVVAAVLAALTWARPRRHGR